MTTATIDETDNVTKADLVACVPHLRAFARFLTGNRECADDLVRDTVVRTLASVHQFHPGTNLKVWMFAILRNLRHSELWNKHGQSRSFDDTAAQQSVTLLTHEGRFALGDIRQAFWQLGEDEREVLILVGPSGLSYEEAAKVCDCPRDTIKSRVSQARRELLRMLQEGSVLADR